MIKQLQLTFGQIHNDVKNMTLTMEELKRQLSDTRDEMSQVAEAFNLLSESMNSKIDDLQNVLISKPLSHHVVDRTKDLENVRDWIAAECKLGLGYKIRSLFLYTAFETWARTNNKEAITHKRFSTILTLLKFHSGHDNKGNICRVGIALSKVL